MPKYIPEHNDPCFSSIRTFMRLPNIRDLDEVDFAIVGLPFDTGSSNRIGSRFAPEAIRSVSASLGSFNTGINISIFDFLSGIDYGDVKVVPGFVENSLEKIEQTLSVLHNSNVIPIGIGGDHTVTLGELRSISKKNGPIRLLLFDSHHDCWNSYQGMPYFHSTVFRRAAEENLIDVGHSVMCGLRGSVYSAKSWNYAREIGFEVITASEMHFIGSERTCQKILSIIGECPMFLSFDMDFIDPAFAPGVGTPEIGGFSTRETIEILRGLKGINIRAADLVEVIPIYDNSLITSVSASNIIFEILSLLAWYKSKKQMG